MRGSGESRSTRSCNRKCSKEEKYSIRGEKNEESESEKIYLHKDSIRTIQIGLRVFQTTNGVEYNLILAGIRFFRKIVHGGTSAAADRVLYLPEIFYTECYSHRLERIRI